MTAALFHQGGQHDLGRMPCPVEVEIHRQGACLRAARQGCCQQGRVEVVTIQHVEGAAFGKQRSAQSLFAFLAFCLGDDDGGRAQGQQFHHRVVAALAQ